MESKTKSRALRNGGMAFLSAIALTCSTSVESAALSERVKKNLSTGLQCLVRITNSISKDTVVLSVLTVLIAVLIALISSWTFEKHERGLAKVFAVFFSAVQLFCRSYSDSDSWVEVFGSRFILLRAMFVIFGTSIAAYYLLLALFHLADRISETADEDKEKKVLSAKRFGLAVLFILLCWLPYFVVYYPGTGNVDTHDQIAQFFGRRTWSLIMTPVQGDDIYLTNHFPFFTTVLWGSFAKLGVWLGNISYGIALYTILQMILIATVLAGMCFQLWKAGLPEKLLKAGLLLVALFPVYPLYAICMLKDTLFSVSCLMTTMLLFEIVRTEGECFRKKGFQVILFLNTLLMMLFRSQGVYIMAVIALVILLVYRRRWRSVLLSFVLPIVLFQLVWTQILLPAWKVAPAGRQEMLGSFFQQTARYLKYYPEDVTEEEKEVINRILPYEELAQFYDPNLSDPIKYRFNQASTQEELKAYFSVWLRMFLRHPNIYVEATLNNSYRFFYPSYRKSIVYLDFKLEPVYKEDAEIHIELSAKTQPARKIISYVLKLLQRLPVVGLFFSVGIYPWIIFYYFFHMACKRKYLFFVVGLAALLSVAVLLICPANGNKRYIMPLFYTAPYLIGLCLLGGANRQTPEETQC